ncbi:MAG: anti-sigma factor [Usitatibacter sp.]
MRTLSPDLAHALAAEYVLGTLRGRVRRRFEVIAAADAAVAGILKRWEDALTPLAEGIEPVPPPARVWKAIEARIGPLEGARAPVAPASAFWRAFGMLSGGLAAVLVVAFLGYAPRPAGDPLFVAVVTAPDSSAHMVISMHEPDLLRVRTVKPWSGTEGRSLELWVLPKRGAPRSLGLVSNTPGDTVIRIAPGDPRVRDANALAISLEPPGGSPTQQPTGPVLGSGVIAPSRKT